MQCTADSFDSRDPGATGASAATGCQPWHAAATESQPCHGAAACIGSDERTCEEPALPNIRVLLLQHIDSCSTSCMKAG